MSTPGSYLWCISTAVEYKMPYQCSNVQCSFMDLLVHEDSDLIRNEFIHGFIFDELLVMETEAMESC